MLTRQLTLTVSASFEVPFVYLKHNIQEIEEALLLGSMVQSSVKTTRSTEEVKKIIEVKDIEIQQIQKSYQDKLTKLLDDLQQTSEEKNKLNDEYLEKMKLAQQQERDHTTKEYEEKMKFLRRDMEALTSKCNALEVCRKTLEESRSKDIQDAVQRTEVMMDKIVLSKQDQLSKKKFDLIFYDCLFVFSLVFCLDDLIYEQTKQSASLIFILESALVKTKFYSVYQYF